MTTEAPTSTDGRHARRERNRIAVIDAVFSLLDEGRYDLPTDAIAERAGVSVSSVFRYFDNLDDLQQQAITRHFERFAPLFDIAEIGQGARAERINAMVDARVELYRAAAPIARLARARAFDIERLARTLEETRASFIEQIRVHFAPELGTLSRPDRDDAVAVIDALTSFESWDLLSTTHGRTDRLIRRAWSTGISQILPSDASGAPSR